MTQVTKWATAAQLIAQDYTMAPSCAKRIEAALVKVELQTLAQADQACFLEFVEHKPGGDNTYNEAVQDCRDAIARLMTDKLPS